MKFENTINKHLTLLREQDPAAEVPPAGPAAMEAPPADPAAAPPAEPAPPEEAPEESPDVQALRVQNTERVRKALLMDQSELDDMTRAKLAAGEVTSGNVDEKEKLIHQIVDDAIGDGVNAAPVGPGVV